MAEDIPTSGPPPPPPLETRQEGKGSSALPSHSPPLSHPKGPQMLYDDEDHDLFLTPHISTYSATRGGASRHMIVNGRNQRIAIKIKCSNNDLYRVSPVFCTLEPGQSVRLQIVRDAGKPGIDKIIVLYRPTRSNNPRDAFKNLGDQDTSDIRKKLIGLVAKLEMGETMEDIDALPPPIPETLPPIDCSPPPMVPTMSIRRRPPSQPPNRPPPAPPPLAPAKSIRRKGPPPPALPPSSPPADTPPMNHPRHARTTSKKRVTRHTSEPPKR